MHHLCHHHHHHHHNHHHYHHHHYHYYFIIIFTTKPGLECRLARIINFSIEFMIGFNFSFVSKRIKNSKESLIQKSSCDWVSEKILNGTYQPKHIPFLLFSYVQTDATLLANNSQHCFLLHVVGCSCAKFETGQTFSPVQTDTTFGRPTTANKEPWEMLRPFARSMVIVFFFFFDLNFYLRKNFLCLNFARSFIRGVFLIYNFAITLQSGKTRN